MKNILILGGDNRNVFLFNLLNSEGYNVQKCFLESDLKEKISKSDVIISGIPFSKDGEFITNNFGETIKISSFLKYMEKKIFIAGKIDKKIVEELQVKNNYVIDLMENNKLAIRNTIPTVEGIVSLIIGNTDFCVCDSNIAVLGFGRVGKQATKILKSLGANVFVYEINKNEVANITLSGYNILNDFENSLSNMNVIVNTVPSRILEEKQLNYLNEKVLIIDVSSNPGGVDYDYADKKGIKVIHALGIPGKVAPKTVAVYIYEAIKDFIK